MEDLDRPREVPGAAARILATLERFGFEWDGEIVYQSARHGYYEAALERLHAARLTFACTCSRAQLEDELRYPGICRLRGLAQGKDTAIRLAVEPQRITFTDRIQGTYRQDVAAAVGDIILRRRDQLHAYVLAVVVDDAQQGVTHVVRGADLLDHTPRQILLMRLLGLPEPSYAHVPVLTEANGSKLAKSRRSVHLDPETALPQLLEVFSLLGLAPPASLKGAGLATAWTWAIGHWSADQVPKRLDLPVNS